MKKLFISLLILGTLTGVEPPVNATQTKPLTKFVKVKQINQRTAFELCRKEISKKVGIPSYNITQTSILESNNEYEIYGKIKLFDLPFNAIITKRGEITFLMVGLDIYKAKGGKK